MKKRNKRFPIVGRTSHNWETCVPQLRDDFPTIGKHPKEPYEKRRTHAPDDQNAASSAPFTLYAPWIRRFSKKVKAVKGRFTTVTYP